MNGCLIPDTPIMVDLWKRVSNPGFKHYFLTHMHSDHTQGLSASWRWPIYCSPLSAKMLVDKFQIKEDLIRPLELNQSNLIRLDHVGREMMTVTLFDANHCPGSVMFLFEGYFGRILYTGDFRYDPSTFPEACVGSRRPVDKLYLDNTFNNPRCRFPSRRECKQEVLEILANYPDHKVVLGVYTLGKEELLVDIALALNTRVVVSPARMRMLQLLELLDVFTTDKNEGHVQLIPRRAISKKNMAKWNEEAPTIAIIPTGLFSLLDGQPFINQDDVFIIPYSDHSSYPELRQFVSRVCPRAIIPIVKDSFFMNSNRSVMDMHNFDNLLDRSPSAPFDIPPSVLQFMSTDHSISKHLGESCMDLKKIIELRKIQGYSRRSNHTATGVVFQEEEDEKVEIHSSEDSVEHILCNVDSQQPQLADNESSNVCDLKTLSQQKILNNSCEARGNGSISHNSCEQIPEATHSKVLKLSEGPTSLIRERNSFQNEAKRGQKTSQNEHSPQLSSENEGIHMSQKPSVRKKDFLTKSCKRKSDEIGKAEHLTCLEADSVLIRSMSNKRPRILPASCVKTPKLTENVQSSREIDTSACTKSSSKKIQDYFNKLDYATPGDKQSVSVPHAQSEHNPCDLNIASFSAATSFQGTDAVIQKAVVDALILTKVKPQRKIVKKDMQESLNDEMHLEEKEQNTAGTIPDDEQFENSSTSAEGNLDTLPPNRTDCVKPSRCLTREFIGRVCVKPITSRQRFAHETDSRLMKAFKNVFADQL